MNSVYGDRFEFQRDAVRETSGIVLNVGCHTDGAGLKGLAPERVLSCDLEVQPTCNYHVDVFFDVRDPWPIKHQSVELVVMADILEHLMDNEIIHCMSEAARVSEKFCATVPNDYNLMDDIDWGAAYKAHCNTINERKLRSLLNYTGWSVDYWYTISREPEARDDYLVIASRA